MREACEQRLVAGQQARLHEVGHDRDVGARDPQAVAMRPNAVPHGEADIPEKAQEVFGEGLGVGVPRAVLEQQQVDIGGGMEFAASVASHRHERHRQGVWEQGLVSNVGLAQDLINQRRA
nr:hypothetical protein [Acidiferrobacter thiooxydans]